MVRTQENIRVRIPGKIYARAFREKWLPSLAMFVFMTKTHSGKNYYFKTNEKTKLIKKIAEQYGIGVTQVSKHLRILSDNGLIEYHPNEMRLVSNRKLFRTRCKFVFVPDNISSYKDIKQFLNALPILSNIVNQEKAIERIKRFSYISERAAKCRHSVTGKDLRTLKVYQKKGGKMNFNSHTQLSIKRIMELTEKNSRSVAIKYKKFLQEKGLVKIMNEFTRTTIPKLPKTVFYNMKEQGLLPENSFWWKGYVYENRPSVFHLAYRETVCSLSTV